MYYYSEQSRDKLEQAHHLLQLLFNEAIKYYDISIICGYRGEDRQNHYYDSGLSKLRFPESKHNQSPSLAVDFAVYHKFSGVSFNERDMILVAGFLEGLAEKMGIPIRLGARWDKPWISENSFKDIGHIELDSSKLRDPDDYEQWR